MVTSEIVDYKTAKKTKVKSEPGSPQAAVTITFVSLLFSLFYPLTYLSCSIPAASSFVKTAKRKLSFGSIALVNNDDVPSGEEDGFVLDSPIAITPKRSRKPSAKAVYMTDDSRDKMAMLVRLLYS